ncbi:amidohydrolase family protein [Oleiharenicola lentus]|uniref:amidohydrolase family protein n=1 Tax=Oleiharenicola lentus TaxID=2508720 RepID=UPI003F681249
MNPSKPQHYRIIACALLLLLLMLAPFLLGARRPPQPLPDSPIIDMHCHTAGLGAGGSGCFVSEKLRNSFKLRFYLKSFGVTEEEILREGDALVLRRLSAKLAESKHVSRAVVLALDGVVDEHGNLDRARTEFYVPNEFLAAEIPHHKNLWWGASVNPLRPDALARLDWAKTHGAVLVKWLPSVQDIDPADERFIPYYKKLAALGLPLLTHTGNERAFTHAHDELCDPARLRLALECGVTVIAAHAATTGEFANEPSLDHLAKLMTEFPNLYADISSLTQINKRTHLAKVLSRPEFTSRLVYGTDYPLIAIRSLVSPWYFPRELGLKQTVAFSKIKNPWDRDIAMKQALGVRTETWTRFESLMSK